MNLLQRFKRLLLPYEETDHPMYCPPPEEPDEAWDDLGKADWQIKYRISSDPHTDRYL